MSGIPFAGSFRNADKSGFRFVLESGSAEGFLRDLLAIELKERGYSPIREYRTKSGNIVDLAVKEAPPEYVEAKQLHLKDGAQFVKNVARDLKRHARCRCLGVIPFPFVFPMSSSRFLPLPRKWLSGLDAPSLQPDSSPNVAMVVR